MRFQTSLLLVNCSSFWSFFSGTLSFGERLIVFQPGSAQQWWLECWAGVGYWNKRQVSYFLHLVLGPLVCTSYSHIWSNELIMSTLKKQRLTEADKNVKYQVQLYSPNSNISSLCTSRTYVWCRGTVMSHRPPWFIHSSLGQRDSEFLYWWWSHLCAPVSQRRQPLGIFS